MLDTTTLARIAVKIARLVITTLVHVLSVCQVT